jgi:SOS-response transcriptional repressor LexA
MMAPDNSHMVARLAANDAKVLAFIVGFKRRHDGLAPTMSEIADACGFSTNSLVSFYLTRLEGQRLIRRHEGRPGGIEVVGGRWIPPEANHHG